MIENPATPQSPSEGVLIARGLLDRIIEKQMKESTAGLPREEADYAHLSICGEEVRHALQRFSKATGRKIDQAMIEWWPEGAIKKLDMHVERLVP